jgi:hypothetical protein
LSRIAPEETERLTQAIHAQDCLRRILGELEGLHRVVFHDNPNADWSLARRSAEQILIAEIVSRFQGYPDGVYFALRALEDGGKTWEAALRDTAAAMHSYYTTPLGIVMRQDLFGDQAVFFTPDAETWTQQLRGGPEGGEPPRTS